MAFKTCKICKSIIANKHNHKYELRRGDFGYKAIYIDGIEYLSPTNEELAAKFKEENKEFIAI